MKKRHKTNKQGVSHQFIYSDDQAFDSFEKMWLKTPPPPPPPYYVGQMPTFKGLHGGVKKLR